MPDSICDLPSRQARRLSYAPTAMGLTVYGVIIRLDPSSLTASTAGMAEQPASSISCSAARAGLWGGRSPAGPWTAPVASQLRHAGQM
jgi:hypothetical protein